MQSRRRQCRARRRLTVMVMNTPLPIILTPPTPAYITIMSKAFGFRSQRCAESLQVSIPRADIVNAAIVGTVKSC